MFFYLILISFPVVFLIFSSDSDLDELGKFFKYFLLILFFTTIPLLIFEIIISFINAINSFGITFIISFLLILFYFRFTHKYSKMKFENENIFKHLTLIFVFLALYTIIDLLLQFGYSDVSVDPSESEIFALLIYLIVLSIFTIGTLYLTKRFIEKKEELKLKEKKTSGEDLNKIIWFYIIAIVSFVLITACVFLGNSEFTSKLYNAQFDFEESNDLFAVLMQSVIYDPKTYILGAFIAFGSMVKGYPLPQVKVIGNMVLIFLPFFFWLMAFFDGAPLYLVELFGVWGFLADFVYLVLLSMTYGLLLAVSNLITALVS